MTLCDPWTIACQAALSMGFPRKGLPFPSPGDLSNPGTEPTSPALAGRFITAESQGKLVDNLVHAHVVQGKKTE